MKPTGFALPFVLTILLFVPWEVIAIIFKIPPFNLPLPTNILQTMFTFAPQLTVNALRTFWTSPLGFVLAVGIGVILGFLIGYSKVAYLTLYPLLVAFNTIPKAAVVPLLTIWFEANAIPATLTPFLLTFFRLRSTSLWVSTP